MWWNAEIQVKVKVKQLAFKRMIYNNVEEENESLRADYKTANIVAKRAVAKAKDEAFEHLYKTLD